MYSLFLGVLCTVSIFLDCRSPAFWQCAVTLPTVRLASLEPADHLVGAACNPTLTCTTTVFAADTPGGRGGGAACHGARLLLFTAVYGAMRRSTTACVGGAAIKLALALSTMLVADTSCFCKGAAAFRLAHLFAAVTAVPVAVSLCFRCGSSCAVAERAEPKGAMLFAEFTSLGSCTTP